MVGVVAYIDANDIPGINDWKNNPTPEPIFSAGRSEYAGQAVGLIVAETREIAVQAAKAVVITYANKGEVVTDMEVAMSNPDNVMVLGSPTSYGEVDSAMASADSIISGRFRMGSQYHFTLETHVCIAKPTEDGFDIELPTQGINISAVVISKALKTPVNRYNLIKELIIKHE